MAVLAPELVLQRFLCPCDMDAFAILVESIVNWRRAAAMLAHSSVVIPGSAHPTSW